jgi:hypothetical protein
MERDKKMTDNNKLTEVSTQTFHAREMGLVIEGTPTIDEWIEYGRKLRRVETSMNWIIGDYLVYGEFKYGEKYAQALDESMANSWKVYHWVSKHVPPKRRRADLSWSHHRLIANLPAEYQTKVLEKAANEHLAIREVGRMLRRVSDGVFDAVIRTDDDSQDRTLMEFAYKRTLKSMMDDAIEAGIPIEMSADIYSKYVKLSGTGRCPHCQGIILLSDFFATKVYRNQDFIRSTHYQGTQFKPGTKQNTSE